MKKIIFALVFSILYVTSFAQIQFGLHADGLMADAKEIASNLSYKSKNVLGFEIGGIAKKNITSQILIAPELNIVLKGSNLTYTQSYYNYPGTNQNIVHTEFVELPLNFIYTSKTKIHHFFVGLGPVLSMGIGGQGTSKSTTDIVGSTQVTTTNLSVKFDNVVSTSDNNLHLKPFEFGANALLGYNIKKNINIKATYNIGFSNLMPSTINNNKYKTSYLGLGVQYMFDKKDKKIK